MSWFLYSGGYGWVSGGGGGAKRRRNKLDVVRAVVCSAYGRGVGGIAEW